MKGWSVAAGNINPVTDNEIVKSLESLLDRMRAYESLQASIGKGLVEDIISMYNRQKAEIISRTEEYNDMLEQRNKVEEALEVMTMDVNSLTSERDALQEMVAEQKAENERLRYILVNFMGEIFDWGNKNGVDTRIFAQTAILGKEKDGAVKQIKSEAYREFAESVYKFLCNKHNWIVFKDQWLENGECSWLQENLSNLAKQLTRNSHGTCTEK